MTLFDVTAVLLCLAALIGLVNYHWLRLPNTIGLVVVAFTASLALMGLDALIPGLGIAERVRAWVEGIDFRQVLLDGMLSFLLFAGALHVDFADLAREKWPILALATLGTGFSTVIVGCGFHLLAGVPLAVALVFGALISPTDPVAVLGIVRSLGVPKALEVKIAGESLFNDGIGIVLVLLTSAVAFGGAEAAARPGAVALLFAREALGGAALGAATGYAAYLAIRSVDEHNLEAMLTLALVTGTYAIAHTIEVSGPIAVVVAGLVIGNRGLRYGMSGETRDRVQKFWSLLDEILNAVLFLLIGLEVFAAAFPPHHLGVALAAVPLVLAARLASVAFPVGVLSLLQPYRRGMVTILTWGGLRGGISVALALSLPPVPDQPTLLTATYAVVIFSIVVQGLTVRRVVGWFGGG